MQNEEWDRITGDLALGPRKTIFPFFDIGVPMPPISHPLDEATAQSLGQAATVFPPQISA